MEPAAWIACFDGEVMAVLEDGVLGGAPEGAGRMLVTQALA